MWIPTRFAFMPQEQLLFATLKYLTYVLCNRHHIFFMAFFPILLSRKQKRCVFGQKSKFEKKNFFRRPCLVFLDSKVGKMPKSAHVKNTQITVKTQSIWYFFRITQVFFKIKWCRIFISMLRGQDETCLGQEASLVLAPEHRNENPTPLYLKKNLSYSEKIPY